MAKLVSMQLTAAEREEAMGGSIAGKPQGPRYPWGLSVTLDNDTLDKLGLTLPTVGKTLTLIARVAVTSVSSTTESPDGGPNRSVSLQITDLCVEDEDAAADAAKALYTDTTKA